MIFPRFLLFLATVLFGLIAVSAIVKSMSSQGEKKNVQDTHLISQPIVIPSSDLLTEMTPAKEETLAPRSIDIVSENNERQRKVESVEENSDVNLIERFFTKNEDHFPIVEVVTYKSHVDWLKGRPAWLSDYAAHFHTSRHFIARSLNGKPDYLTQQIKDGDKFAVLRNDIDLQFYLLIDTSRCKMWFYYFDLTHNEKVLVKTYRVGLGRVDASKPSGLLTPLGKYLLGNKIAIYKPKMVSTHQGKKRELITVFGTRWIPFEKELGICTAPAKSFGLHGTPWDMDQNGSYQDNTQSLGKYESDGCVRLATADIEELFAIIITKPAVVEIVRDFSEASFSTNISE